MFGLSRDSMIGIIIVVVVGLTVVGAVLLYLYVPSPFNDIAPYILIGIVAGVSYIILIITKKWNR